MPSTDQVENNRSQATDPAVRRLQVTWEDPEAFDRVLAWLDDGDDANPALTAAVEHDRARRAG